MKRFQIITEADARVLDYGTTVVLVAGGHVTPLAQDTLVERRIAVVREGTDVDAELLAPPADIRIVAIAGDHPSLALKQAIVQHLRQRGIAVPDAMDSTAGDLFDRHGHVRAPQRAESRRDTRIFERLRPRRLEAMSE